MCFCFFLKHFSVSGMPVFFVLIFCCQAFVLSFLVWLFCFRFRNALCEQWDKWASFQRLLVAARFATFETGSRWKTKIRKTVKLVIGFGTRLHVVHRDSTEGPCFYFRTMFNKNRL